MTQQRRARNKKNRRRNTICHCNLGGLFCAECIIFFIMFWWFFLLVHCLGLSFFPNAVLEYKKTFCFDLYFLLYNIEEKNENISNQKVLVECFCLERKKSFFHSLFSKFILSLCISYCPFNQFQNRNSSIAYRKGLSLLSSRAYAPFSYLLLFGLWRYLRYSSNTRAHKINSMYDCQIWQILDLVRIIKICFLLLFGSKIPYWIPFLHYFYKVYLMYTHIYIHIGIYISPSVCYVSAILQYTSYHIKVSNATFNKHSLKTIFLSLHFRFYHFSASFSSSSFRFCLAPENQILSQCSILSDMFSLGMVMCTIFNQGHALIQANNSASTYLKQLEMVSRGIS